MLKLVNFLEILGLPFRTANESTLILPNKRNEAQSIIPLQAFKFYRKETSNKGAFLN
jgi:hypothetical protein